VRVEPGILVSESDMLISTPQRRLIPLGAPHFQVITYYIFLMNPYALTLLPTHTSSVSTLHLFCQAGPFLAYFFTGREIIKEQLEQIQVMETELQTLQEVIHFM